MITKVKSVTGNGSFKNDFGALQPNGDKLLFSFEYEMEDGTILKANHKTNTSPFPPGSEVEYEITKTDPKFGKSGKVGKPKEVPTQNNSNSQANNDSSKVSPDVWRKKDVAGAHQDRACETNGLYGGATESLKFAWNHLSTAGSQYRH